MTDLVNFEPQFVKNTPGFFRLEAEQYHAAPGVSQTMLGKLGSRSPAHLQAWLASERKSTPTQVFGSLAHLALFEPEKLIEGASHWIQPDGLDLRTKVGKEWKAAHDNGVPVIDRDEWTALKGICDSAHSHSCAGLLEAHGHAEVSAFATSEYVNSPDVEYPVAVAIKCRIDRLVQSTDGRIYIIDAKTTEDASPHGFLRSIEQYGYFRQAAYYIDVLHALGVPVADFYWLAVEKEPPYAVGIYRLGQGQDGEPDDIEVGRRTYRKELDVYARCLRENKWPGYSQNIERLELRKWVREGAL